MRMTQSPAPNHEREPALTESLVGPLRLVGRAPPTYQSVPSDSPYLVGLLRLTILVRSFAALLAAPQTFQRK